MSHTTRNNDNFSRKLRNNAFVCNVGLNSLFVSFHIGIFLESHFFFSEKPGSKLKSKTSLENSICFILTINSNRQKMIPGSQFWLLMIHT